MFALGAQTMFGSEMLEVAAGLIFLFFILSLILTSAREIIEGFLQTRAIHLERGIRELLKDQTGQNLVKELYSHPMINSLFRGDYPKQLVNRWYSAKDKWQRAPFRSNLPAYIPAKSFAIALLDLAARGLPKAGVSDRDLSMDRIRQGLDVNITDPHVRRAVLLALDQAKGDLDQAKANIATWFDTGMDRVSGWYRKETQGVLLVLGLLVAFALNIDSLKVAKALYENDTLRSVIVSDAQAVAERAKAEGADPADQTAMLRALGCGPELAAGGSAAGAAETRVAPAADAAAQPAPKAAAQPGPAPTRGAEGDDAAAARARNAKADISCAERRIRNLGLPVGWGDKKILWQQSWPSWWQTSDFPWRSIPGWLVTALAISLGAPFWFDMLNKVMVIRSTVKPHEKSPEESSEDRQTKSDAAAARAAAPAPAAPVPPAPAAAAPPPRAEAEPNRTEADEDEFAGRDLIGKIDPREDEE
jgi:hypothetical protein